MPSIKLCHYERSEAIHRLSRRFTPRSDSYESLRPRTKCYEHSIRIFCVIRGLFPHTKPLLVIYRVSHV